jgi:5,10-methylenetetrahydromethanopterin reductase
MEFWTSNVASPTRSADFARRAEELGWDGMMVVDSQNLSGDPYVCLALGATASDGLGLMTSVTNPVTRHAAVTATSALSVQRLSGGRMVLGIGRGDSALAHLGRAPARLTWFEQYVANLQAYLRGDEVAFDAAGVPDDVAPPVDDLGLADAPTASAIQWAGDVTKVPVEVAATGARVIGLTARHADRVMLAVGADPRRIRWGIETAQRAADEAGRDPAELGFGAYVNVVCHDDRAVARELGRAGTGLFARFSVMHGQVNGPADEAQTEVFRNVHDRYDMHAHGRSGGQQTTALTDEFMDGFAVIGGVDECVDRLGNLAELGVDKFAVTGPNFSSRSPDGLEAATNFTEQVMPQLRR